MTRAVLPRRDPGSVRMLADVARTARPVVLARERRLPLADPLAAMVPGGSLVRGSVVAIVGPAGGGVTSLSLQLAAAATGVGEWAAVVEPTFTVGGLAAIEAGVTAERFIVVPRVAPARWVVVVAALLEGVSLVVATTPPALSIGDARRLTARARERGAVLVLTGGWPAEVGLRLHVRTSAWSGLDAGSGWLGERMFGVRAEEHGIATRVPVSAIAG